MPLAENVVAVLPVVTVARFASPDPDPASMKYEVTGSPEDGAPHVSVTVAPLDELERLVGAPGAVAAAPTVRICRRAAPARHPGSPAAWRHRPKSMALAPKSAVGVDCAEL